MKRGLRLNHMRSRFLNLFRHPLFWALTFAGNSAILGGGILLYLFETDIQPARLSLLDSVLWAMGMITTSGYGNWTPLTLGGKLTSGVLMLGGTLFVWSYMAFLVTGLITPELNVLEADVHRMEKDIQNLRAGKFEDPL